MLSHAREIYLQSYSMFFFKQIILKSLSAQNVFNVFLFLALHTKCQNIKQYRSNYLQYSRLRNPLFILKNIPSVWTISRV